MIDATLRYEANEFSGKARIQSIRPWRKGQVRIGLGRVNPREGDGQLQKGMKEICMAVQRLQLRRLAATR